MRNQIVDNLVNNSEVSLFQGRAVASVMGLEAAESTVSTVVAGEATDG